MADNPRMNGRFLLAEKLPLHARGYRENYFLFVPKKTMFKANGGITNQLFLSRFVTFDR